MSAEAGPEQTGPRSWLAPLIGGAAVGGLFGVVYPWLQGRLADTENERR